MDGSLTPAAPRSAELGHALIGRAVEVEGLSVVLAAGSRRITARRATSCLVEPVPGDLLAAIDTADGCYVTAVLDRPSEAGAVLSVPGTASATLAQPELKIVCETLAVEAGRADLRTRLAQVAGQTLSAVAERLDLVARVLRRTADQEFSHAKVATRNVEGVETVSAGELMLEGRSVLAQRAGIILLDAREDVRVNGERITMG